MSKYVKEMMMNQLKAELGEAKSVLILDFKGLGGVAENKLRLDLRKKKIQMRAVKNTLAKRVFSDAGIVGLDPYLSGPSVAVWGGESIADLAKEIAAQVKKLKKPKIKGGAVDGVSITAAQVDELTKLPSREVLIGQVLTLLLGPAQKLMSQLGSPASTVIGQLEALVERQGGEPAPAEPEAEPETETVAAPAAEVVAAPAAEAVPETEAAPEAVAAPAADAPPAAEG